MSKKLILCVVLALSLILVGTGYAYWTDTLNVTTKATTGDLDVTFVDLGAYAQYGNEHSYNPSWWSIIDGISREVSENNGLFNGYIGAEFFQRGTTDYNSVFGGKDDDYYDNAEDFNSVRMDADLQDPGTGLGKDYPDYPYGEGDFYGDTISITLNKLYPGYAQAFRSDIINIGSIAAKLSQVEFDVSATAGFNNTEETNSLIGVALLVQDENPVNYGNIVKLADNFIDPANKFTLGGVEFVRLSALEKLDEVTIANNFILVPGATPDPDDPIREHRADLFIGIAVDPDAAGKYTTGTVADMKDNNDSDSQNKGVQLDITFGWDQFNEGINPNTTNILNIQN